MQQNLRLWWPLLPLELVAGILKWWNSVPWVCTWPQKFSGPSTPAQAALVKQTENLRWSLFSTKNNCKNQILNQTETVCIYLQWYRKPLYKRYSYCFYHPIPNKAIIVDVYAKSSCQSSMLCAYPWPSTGVIIFSGPFFLQLPSLLTPEYLLCYSSWILLSYFHFR